jgi:hypothetical protein
VVTQNSNNIEITIESQVSTAQQIVDAFNAFATTNTLELEAATSCPDTSQKEGISGRILNGIDENKVVLTFSSDIEASSIADRIRVTSQPLFPAMPEQDVYFETSVNGNEVTLTFPD